MKYANQGASLIAQLVKKICLQCRRPWFDSWVRKIRWRRDRLPNPVFLGFPCGSAGKEYAYNTGDLGLIPRLGRFSWRRERLPTPVFWGFPGVSVGKESACNMGDLGLIPRLGRYPGEGHWSPFQYSCLENPHGQRSLTSSSNGPSVPFLIVETSYVL